MHTRSRNFNLISKYKGPKIPHSANNMTITYSISDNLDCIIIKM